MTVRAIQQTAVIAVIVFGQACTPDDDGTLAPDAGNRPAVEAGITAADAALANDAAQANDAAVSTDAAKADAAVAIDAAKPADAEPPSDAARSPDAATAADASGAEASVGDGGGSACTQGTGQCNNATDCAFTKAAMDGWVLECARAAVGDEAMTTTCMKGKGLTQGCSACWGASAGCSATKCLVVCALDPDGASCRDCTTTMCDPTFKTCSGL